MSQAGPTCEKLLRQYVLEAQRMTSRQRNLRICAQDCSIDGHNFKRGEAVICLLGQAGHDTSCVPDPHVFKPGRPAEAYIHFGHGPHECLGREMSLTYCVGLLEVVAGLKHLRPAPGAMGELKCIQVGTEKCYLDDTWSWLTFDPTSKLICSSFILLFGRIGVTDNAKPGSFILMELAKVCVADTQSSIPYQLDRI